MPESTVSVEVLSILLALLVFAIGVLFVQLVVVPKRSRLKDRLSNTEDLETEYMMKEESINATPYSKFYKSQVKPKLFNNTQKVQRIAKILGVNLDTLYIRIKEAKLDKKISPEEVLSMKLFGYVGMAVFLLIFIASYNVFAVLIAVTFVFLGVFLPEKWITNSKRKKDDEIIRTLPNFLDNLGAVLEAGMGLQVAIVEVSKRMKGHLADEFLGVTAETRTNGGNFRDAMENMALRNNIDCLSDVVQDILIAQERGVSIAEAVDIEANFMKQIRIDNANSKAKSLSVKILLPLVIFFFIPFMVLILTPVLLKMLRF